MFWIACACQKYLHQFPSWIQLHYTYGYLAQMGFSELAAFDFVSAAVAVAQRSPEYDVAGGNFQFNLYMDHSDQISGRALLRATVSGM